MSGMGEYCIAGDSTEAMTLRGLEIEATDDALSSVWDDPADSDGGESHVSGPEAQGELQPAPVSGAVAMWAPPRIAAEGVLAITGPRMRAEVTVQTDGDVDD